MMFKIMDMLKTRLKFVHDIQEHVYLFSEPEYETSEAKKFLK